MSTEAEQALRDLVAERDAAIHATDLEQLAAPHAYDVVVFNVLPPLRHLGSGQVRAQTHAGFDSHPALSDTTCRTYT
jgi:ketosteroid isomerase-like protein